MVNEFLRKGLRLPFEKSVFAPVVFGKKNAAGSANYAKRGRDSVAPLESITGPPPLNMLS